jgi:tetratricopeptide (TPR) repeat protein
MIKKGAKTLSFPTTRNAAARLLAGTFLVFALGAFASLPVVRAAATGGQPGQFVAWGAGARSLGMGKAFFAVADDASATYWNPAAMTQLDRKEIMALHAELFAETNFNFLSYVHPTAKSGVFGGNITRLHSGGFEKIAITFDAAQEDIIKIDNLGTFDDSRLAFTLAYGKKIQENLSIGLAGKYISHTLDTSISGAFTTDLTMFLEGVNHTVPGIKLGFGVNNIISSSFGDTDDVMPLIFRMGASHKFLKNKLLVAFDIDKSLMANLGWHIGTEYYLMNYLAMRLGFEGESGIRETTAGFGFKYKDYGLDYAFALHELGLSHRVSGSWKIGDSVSVGRTAAVARLMKEAVESYRKGDLLLAHNRLERLLDIDPANKDAQNMSRRLQVIIGHIDTVVGDTEDAVAARKGIVAYLESDDAGAINSFRYAYYKKPENVKLLALLNRIEKEIGLPPTEAYKESIAGFTIVDQKVFDSRQAIIDGKYDKALMRAQEILNLEPNHVTALEIMGSAFFMMDQPDKAKEVWMKVLEVDPTNKVVPQFLNQLK